MINDLFRTYKKIIILLLLLLCSVVFWFYGCRHQQRGQKIVVEWDKKTLEGTNGYCYKFKTENCTGSVVFGVAGYVARDKEMPVTLKIRSTDKSFAGVMKVTLPGENGKGIAYQSAIRCQRAEEQTITLNVPQLGNPSVICFEIKDSFGVTQLSENVSFSVIFIGFILLCIVMYQRKNWKSYFTYVLPVVCGAIGYLLLLLSPSGSAKFSENLSLPLIFKNAVEIFTEYYNTCRIPLIFFFVLLGIALYYKLDKKEILIALAFFFISVIASGMLVIASYLPERSLANGIVFLIIGIVQLLQLLRSNTRLECVSLCVCIYLIVGSLMSYWEGSYDIYRVHKEQAVRDTTIESAVSAGDTVIGVPIITSTTKYCCKYGLLDMNGEASDDPFPNAYIAKYYGLDKIYVIYPDNSGQ